MISPKRTVPAPILKSIHRNPSLTPGSVWYIWMTEERRPGMPNLPKLHEVIDARIGAYLGDRLLYPEVQLGTASLLLGVLAEGDLPPAAAREIADRHAPALERLFGGDCPTTTLFEDAIRASIDNLRGR
ncbi:MAG: hypothetical protein V1856_02790 [Candidatus Liptonbacteria bacterium]